jgi:predicted transcriptional regulator
VSPRRRSGSPRAPGLDALRRGGAVSDLLFLYACTTREVAQLREVAETLGLSVQAASHTYRGLARRGLAEMRSGRYRPTVAGVDFLHGALRALEGDLAERLERLHIVATTQALARARIGEGDAVVLSLENGLLSVRPGSAGASRGVARHGAAAGELVEVERLEGIVPLRPAPVEVLTVPEGAAAVPATAQSLARALARRSASLVAAHGLEAFLLADRAARGRPVERFGVPAVVEEASRLGVPATIVVLDRDAPQLLSAFDRSASPRIRIVPLDRSRGRGPRSR